MSSFKKETYSNLAVAAFSLVLGVLAVTTSYHPEYQSLWATIQSYYFMPAMGLGYLAIAYCNYRRWRIEEQRYSAPFYRVTGYGLVLLGLAVIILPIVLVSQHCWQVQCFDWTSIMQGLLPVVMGAKFLHIIIGEVRYW